MFKASSLQNNTLNVVSQANYQTETFPWTRLIPSLSSAVTRTLSHSTSVLSPYLPPLWTCSHWSLNRAPALSQSAQHTWQDQRLQRYHLDRSSYVNPVTGQQTHPDGLGNAALLHHAALSVLVLWDHKRAQPCHARLLSITLARIQPYVTAALVYHGSYQSLTRRIIDKL